MQDGFVVTRGSRLNAIKSYILAEIGNPALCLEDVAAQQGISSSYVRKLFTAEGTRFTAYVLEIRLKMVLQILDDPDSRGSAISAIALRCGFNDISYFNRVFRRRYGCTPSDLRYKRRGIEAGLTATG